MGKIPFSHVMIAQQSKKGGPDHQAIFCQIFLKTHWQKYNFLIHIRKPLRTSVFSGFLSLWGKLPLRNSLLNKELAIFLGTERNCHGGFI
jgi:hypothetical protein